MLRECGATDARDDVAAMFEAGLANMRKQTKAQPGDKTMMDALVPAVDAHACCGGRGQERGRGAERCGGARHAQAPKPREI